eukprot:SM000022S07286  [mRNA]  locus=s22:917440:919941:- [translate_table: standard]
MGNLICVLVHCQLRGSEAILGSESHIHWYEQGGIATLGGVHSRTVPNKADGTMDLKKVEAAIRPPGDEHFPITRVICIENTHNRCGGRAISAEYTNRLGELAKYYGLKLHVDGARLFNAATALSVAPERLVKAADSISVCLSKGLGAPLGSVVVGTAAFVAEAKRLRKALGGGMRQVGVVAAAGLISINDMVGRLGTDHRNAQKLAEGLNAMDGLWVDLAIIETNIATYLACRGMPQVHVDVTAECPMGVNELCEAVKQAGILVCAVGRSRIRLVTHHHISEEDVRQALAVFQEILLQSAEQEEERQVYI